MDWWLTLLPFYLDADRDGKGSIQEFYDVKVVQVLRILFDGLDVNSDGLVKKNEARLESFFRPVFLRSITQELFDYLGKNNDNQTSPDARLEVLTRDSRLEVHQFAQK